MKLFNYPSDHFHNKTYLNLLPREFRVFQEMSDSNLKDFNHEKMVKLFTLEITKLFQGKGTATLVKEYQDQWTLTHQLSNQQTEEEKKTIRSDLISAFIKYSGVEITDPVIHTFNAASEETETVPHTHELWQAVPIRNLEEVLGMVLINTSENLAELNDKTARLHFLIHHISNELLAIQYSRELLITDPLTGCYNRWFMDIELAKLCAYQNSPRHAFSVLLLDIDHFKSVNDHYGHQEGDHCLILLSEILRKNVRESDHVIRMGGDEFLIIHNQADSAKLLAFANYLQNITRTELKLKSDPDQPLTLSIGALVHSTREVLTAGMLLDRVDHALYDSKRKGRDQITLWSPEIEKNRRLWSKYKTFPVFSESELAEQNKVMEDAITEGENELVNMLKMILNTKEAETSLHSIRVTRITEFLLKFLDISEDEKLEILRGAELHDIGKIAIPEKILHKQGPLNESEWMIMRQHPLIGHSFVKHHPFLKKPGEIILHHHESFDGSGYPHALKGTEIPLGARLFTLIDAYDSMRSNRIYQEFISEKDAIQELKNKSGIQFDPDIVDLFLQHIQEIEKIGCWQVEGKG